MLCEEDELLTDVRHMCDLAGLYGQACAITCMWLGLIPVRILPVQVYNPWDQIGLYGQDPGNDLQLSGTYYCAAGHSGQGAACICRVLG